MPLILLLALINPAIYGILLLSEACWPARVYRPVPRWRMLGAAFLILNSSIATLTPLLLPLGWMATHRAMDGSKLGVIFGAVAGFLVTSFTLVVWHRLCHASPLLWRLFHQFHHAPDRVDISSAVLAHPLDTAARTALSILIVVPLLGLDPRAAALSGLVSGIYSLVPHWNVRTPGWLGYIVQRPEAHLLHHERNVHSGNYSDFPLWDVLLGSYRTPHGAPAALGFDPPANAQFASMLMFRDVNRRCSSDGPIRPSDAAWRQ